MNAQELQKIVDPLNFSVVKVEPFFDETCLGEATGFFYVGVCNFDGGASNVTTYWLVTNWHVLSGRNSSSPNDILNINLALPNRVRLTLILNYGHPEYNINDTVIATLFLELYDANGKALWRQHKRKNEIDVAVIKTNLKTEEFLICGINGPHMQEDMAIRVGGNVFVVGYPLGFSHTITLPIWKHGHIASEPYLEASDVRGVSNNNRVVIDATTRSGMSGSPVFLRETSHYLCEDGTIKCRPVSTKWVGIYASKPMLVNYNKKLEDACKDNDALKEIIRDIVRNSMGAEIGYFYRNCVLDVIGDDISGPDYGLCP